MAELKTKPTSDSVEKFLNTIKDPERREDCLTVLKLMKHATKAEPKMWGSAIVGFGDIHYVYESGREGDWFVMGFSPRKANLTLYLMSGLHEHLDSLKKLGKHKTGKGCLYVKSLKDIDLGVLKSMMEKAVRVMKSKIKT
jgi:uncharacterized protein DUF1801